MKHINKAIALDPYSSDKYCKRSYINFKLNKKALAYDDVDKAIKLDPKNPEGYNLRGLYKLNHKRYKDAQEDYKKARKLAEKIQKRQEKIDKKIVQILFLII